MCDENTFSSHSGVALPSGTRENKPSTCSQLSDALSLYTGEAGKKKNVFVRIAVNENV